VFITDDCAQNAIEAVVVVMGVWVVSNSPDNRLFGVWFQFNTSPNSKLDV
jgi:hypothetical protein